MLTTCCSGIAVGSLPLIIALSLKEKRANSSQANEIFITTWFLLCSISTIHRKKFKPPPSGQEPLLSAATSTRTFIARGKGGKRENDDDDDALVWGPVYFAWYEL